MNKVDVSLIIVNWNVRELLIKCVESIFKYTADINYEIIIIDNASRDGSTAELRKKFLNELRTEQLVIIENNQNLGFSKANNQGLREAKGEYILFMNPDMEFIENSLPVLRNYHRAYPEIGLLTTTLLYNDHSIQPNVKNNPRLLDQVIIMLKLHHLFKWKSLSHYLAKDFSYGTESEVEQIMGAFIFTTKKFADELQGFDESYPLWWEDVDLCRRVQKLKRKIIYFPDTSIIHYESRSFAQVQSFKKQRKFLFGLRLYFKKHESHLAYYILCALTPISLALAYIVQLIKIPPRSQSQLSRPYGK